MPTPRSETPRHGGLGAPLGEEGAGASGGGTARHVRVGGSAAIVVVVVVVARGGGLNIPHRVRVVKSFGAGPAKQLPTARRGGIKKPVISNKG